jgi:hypothetical protein
VHLVETAEDAIRFERDTYNLKLMENAPGILLMSFIKHI